MNIKAKKLYINIDHIANVRQSRLTNYPNIISALSICELVNVDGITFHLREDKRHIQDKDVYLIKKCTTLPLNFELSLDERILSIAYEIEPDRVTIVPENRMELTTESGLMLSSLSISNQKKLLSTIQKFQDRSIPVCLFLDPDITQIEKASDMGIKEIELNTSAYSNAYANKETEKLKKELNLINKTSDIAKNIHGMNVYAGHGLYYKNLRNLVSISHIEEFNIGHGVISRAIFLGLEKSIKEIQEILKG